MADGNSILHLIPGEEIAAAMQQLPDPVTADLTNVTTERYVERVGAMVRFEFRLQRPTRRGMRPFWTAVRALYI